MFFDADHERQLYDKKSAMGKQNDAMKRMLTKEVTVAESESESTDDGTRNLARIFKRKKNEADRFCKLSLTIPKLQGWYICIADSQTTC